MDAQRASLPRAHRLVVFWTTGILTALLDQWTKGIVITNIPLHGIMPVISNFLNIVHVRNKGISFSLLASLDARFLLIALAILAVTALHLSILWTARMKRAEVAMYGLILGGAVGNLWDRLTRGSVVDFLDVYVGRFHWPAFNVADSAITCGAVMLAVRLLLSKEQ